MRRDGAVTAIDAAWQAVERGDPTALMTIASDMGWLGHFLSDAARDHPFDLPTVVGAPLAQRRERLSEALPELGE